MNAFQPFDYNAAVGAGTANALNTLQFIGGTQALQDNADARQQRNALVGLTGKAAGGDQSAMGQLLAISPQVAKQVQDFKASATKEELDAKTQKSLSIGRIAQASTTPEAWDANMAASDIPDAQKLVGHFDKRNLALEMADLVPKALNEPFTLGENQTRFDASGKVIASGPKPQSTAKPVAVLDKTSSSGARFVSQDQAIGKEAPMSAFQTGAGGVTPALQQAIQNGTVDPNRVNSRTIGLYNDIAKAGTNAAASHANIAGKTKAYQDSVAYAAMAARTTSVIDKNMPLLVDLADKVNTSGVPIVDSGFTSIRAKGTNNPDVIRYVNTLKTLRTEYANMLAKGSQVTDSMRKDATEAIPSGLSSEGYKQLQQQLMLETGNIIDAANATAASIKFGNAQSGEIISKPDGMNASGGQSPAVARPRAVNPQTGQSVEWDGRAWIPAQ